MLPATVDRVSRHSPPAANEQIYEQTLQNVAFFACCPEMIDRRLEELDREWDIERALEMNMSIIALTGVTLGMVHDRRWLLLPMGVLGFFMQHALQGWCPPLPIMRRLGVRTQSEIEQERCALKALRGDFDIIAPTDEPATRFVAAAVAADLA